MKRALRVISDPDVLLPAILLCNILLLAAATIDLIIRIH